MARRETRAAGVEPLAAVSLSLIEALVARHFLTVLGGFCCEDEEALPAGTRSVLLLGPAEPGYWAHVKGQPEWLNQKPDPIDRWSRRVIGGVACDLGAKALFPFGGAPYQPFYQWAVRTGRVWDSPVRLLVQAEQGLMVSFRGALALKERIEVPVGVSPCEGCARPCLSACPAGALAAGGYDVATCRAHLSGSSGGDCMNFGCAVRRACPVSQGYARVAEHSAYHMGTFHT